MKLYILTIASVFQLSVQSICIDNCVRIEWSAWMLPSNSTISPWPILSINNVIYGLYGGVYKKEYNDMVWTQISNSGLASGSATVINDRYIYFYNDAFFIDEHFSTFDVLNGQFISPDIPSPISINGYCMTSDGDNNIYIVSGTFDMYRGHDLLQTYDIMNGKWSNYTGMPTPVYYHSCIHYGGILYVIGGYSRTHNRQINEIQRWDTTTHQWLDSFYMPYSWGTQHASIALGVDNFIYIIGGWNADAGWELDAGLDTVRVYDPSTNTIPDYMEIDDLNLIKGNDLNSFVVDSRIIVCDGTRCEQSDALQIAPTVALQMAPTVALQIAPTVALQIAPTVATPTFPSTSGSIIFTPIFHIFLLVTYFFVFWYHFN